MLRVVVRSAAFLLASALVGSVAVFVLMRTIKGDPVVVMLGEYATLESIERLRTELGLDRPWHVQYIEWLAGIVQGDLGTSYFGQRDIFTEIKRRFGVTLSLSVGSMAVSVPIALAAGVYSALHNDKRRGALVDLLAQIYIAVPGFWVALLLVVLFAVNLGWLPTGGYVSWGRDPIGALRSLVLPVTAVSLSLAAMQVRYVRSAMIDVLNQDYIRTAMAKGRTFRGSLVVHGIRNASIPLVTVGVLTLGGLVVGAVVTEVIFSLPGLGRMLYDAVLDREVLVVQSLVFVFLLLILTFNFLMDIAYGLLDPRIRESGRSDG